MTQNTHLRKLHYILTTLILNRKQETYNLKPICYLCIKLRKLILNFHSYYYMQLVINIFISIQGRIQVLGYGSMYSPNFIVFYPQDFKLLPFLSLLATGQTKFIKIIHYFIYFMTRTLRVQLNLATIQVIQVIC